MRASRECVEVLRNLRIGVDYAFARTWRRPLRRCRRWVGGRASGSGHWRKLLSWTGSVRRQLPTSWGWWRCAGRSSRSRSNQMLPGQCTRDCCILTTPTARLRDRSIAQRRCWYHAATRYLSLLRRDVWRWRSGRWFSWALLAVFHVLCRWSRRALEGHS